MHHQHEQYAAAESDGQAKQVNRGVKPMLGKVPPRDQQIIGKHMHSGPKDMPFVNWDNNQ
jgi:hypothetical protein